MERKEFITLVWNTNIDEPSSPFLDDIPDEELVEGEEERKSKDSETFLHVIEHDWLMEQILSKKALIIEKMKAVKKSKIFEKEVSISTIKKKDIAAILHKINVFEREFEEKKTKEYA